MEMPSDMETAYVYAGFILESWESGWDCTSRMGWRSFEYEHVDLNSLLYGVEQTMAYYSSELDLGEEDKWLSRSEKRRKLMNERFISERKFFADYSFVDNKPTNYFSAASFYPLFVKMASPQQAADTVKLLPLLEREYALAASEVRDDGLELQWDDPFAWPCLHYIVIRGLLNYGYREDALRLAEKYTALVERNYLDTGDVYEKYDAVQGIPTMSRENTAIHPMRGWSAGVYLWCISLISGTGNQGE